MLRREWGEGVSLPAHAHAQRYPIVVLVQSRGTSDTYARGAKELPARFDHPLEAGPEAREHRELEPRDVDPRLLRARGFTIRVPPPRRGVRSKALELREDRPRRPAARPREARDSAEKSPARSSPHHRPRLR